jgi:hypothetical protein
MPPSVCEGVDAVWILTSMLGAVSARLRLSYVSFVGD